MKQTFQAPLFIVICLMICIPTLLSAQQAYQWKNYPKSIKAKTIASWTGMALSGVVWGSREAFHADPTVFENNFHVKPLSFFGSQGWKLNYYQNDVANGHKPEWFGNMRDFWHTSGFVQKSVVLSCNFTIGVDKSRPLKYKLADSLIGFLIHSAVASMTYDKLRHLKINRF